MKLLLRMMIRHFFIIYTGSIMGTVVYCLIFCRDEMYGIDYFIKMFFFSVLGDLPLLVFYSKEDLTGKQMAGRCGLHFCLLETVLLLAGRYLGLYHKFLWEGVIFFLIVALVYLIVVFFGVVMDMVTADQMNEVIRKKNEGRFR